jgi:hypothetical protein
MKTIKELLTIKLIPEIFDECREAKTEEEIEGILKKNQSPALREVLFYLFSPMVTFDVTIPQYKTDGNPRELSPNSLFIEARRLYIFTTKRPLPQRKKSEILLNILESIHPSEAAFLVNLLETKNVNIPLLTTDLIQRVFPALITI